MKRLALAALAVLLLSHFGQVSAAPPAERARLRQELKANPAKWAARERWIPLPQNTKPAVKERAELKAKGVNNRLLVRAAVYEERAGQSGIAIRELFHQAAPDAARKHGPEEQRAKQAFHQVVGHAKQRFLRQPSVPGLFVSALEGVAQASEASKVGAFRDAMNGLASSLGDKYTCYLPPAKAVELTAASQRQRVGCGVKLAGAESTVTLGAVVSGSPADRAGLRRGDRLLTVNGQLVTSPQQASVLLEGELGSRVQLEVERAGSRQSFEVTRELFNAYPIQSTLARDGVGVLRLPRFYNGSAQDVRQTIAALEQQHGGALRGLVIDLRNNPGGSRPEWLAMLNDFLPQGSLGSNRGQGGRLLQAFEARPEQARYPALPLAVLVNSRSASASERLAGVLKDRDRALVIGEPTFGKDIGQSTHKLADGSSFKVTDVKFHLPSGAAPGVIQPHITSATARSRVEAAIARSRGKTNTALADADLAFAVMKLRAAQPASSGAEAGAQP